MMYLEIDLGNGSVERLRVGGADAVSIGRDASCDVVLPSPDVSRRHVALRLEAGLVHLTDQSANGTFVGEQLDPVHNTTRAIPPLTPFRVGPYSLRVRPSTSESGGLEGPNPNGEAGPTLTPDRGPSHDARAAGRATITAEGDVPVAIRRRIQRDVLKHLDLAQLNSAEMDSEAMRPQVREALTIVVRSLRDELPPNTDLAKLINELTDEALGLGPLEGLLSDDAISEIMVVDPVTIFVERKGRIELTGLRFTDDDAVRSCIERIVTPLGRRIDESNPLVDARLRDGSRVNAVIPPLAIRGPCITIRKFSKNALEVKDLIEFGTLTERMARFLTRCVVAKKNIVISGGTGSGKTTLLNILSGAVPSEERIVTIEDAAELRLPQTHVVSLETRPPNMEGKGAVTIRDLVRNALRMRPDRIIVGECRGGETLDMLQAMNTGHDGSMTTTHANSPGEAVTRLETLALMSGVDLPVRAIREQLATSVDLILQQSRFGDGSRRVTAITEVVGLSDDGSVDHRDIFTFARTETGKDGAVRGEFRATGYLPTFLDEFISHGLVDDGDYL